MGLSKSSMFFISASLVFAAIAIPVSINSKIPKEEIQLYKISISHSDWCIYKRFYFRELPIIEIINSDKDGSRDSITVTASDGKVVFFEDLEDKDDNKYDDTFTYSIKTIKKKVRIEEKVN